MKRGQGRRRGSGLSSRRDKVASDWPWEAVGEAIWGCRALFCTHRIRVPAKLLDRSVTWEVESVSGVWGLAGGWGQPLRSHQSADRWCLYAALRWMRRGYGIGGGRRQSLGDDAETPRRMVTLAVALEKGTGVFSHQQAGGMASLGLAVTNF